MTIRRLNDSEFEIKWHDEVTGHAKMSNLIWDIFMDTFIIVKSRIQKNTPKQY